MAANTVRKDVDLFDVTYQHFGTQVLHAVRDETFGVDIGQNSWLTLDELERFAAGLRLGGGDRVLEVASGSGGPALELVRRTGCRLTGIDTNEHGIATARGLAERARETARAEFRLADAAKPLPFDDASFDALLCVDSMNHFPDRLQVFKEWHRVLRVGGRALITDPVVVTGPVSNDELALRSSIGWFLFVPPGVNERFLEQAGFELVIREDVTANATLVSGRWHRARSARRSELLAIEGEEQFRGLQRFFETVHRLANDGRLSRIAYLVEKRPEGN